MTFTIKWWMVDIAIFLFPFVYACFRKPQGDWDLQLDTMFFFAVCWVFVVAHVLGKLL